MNYHKNIDFLLSDKWLQMFKCKNKEIFNRIFSLTFYSMDTMTGGYMFASTSCKVLLHINVHSMPYIVPFGLSIHAPYDLESH